MHWLKTKGQMNAHRAPCATMHRQTPKSTSRQEDPDNLRYLECTKERNHSADLSSIYQVKISTCEISVKRHDMIATTALIYPSSFGAMEKKVPDTYETYERRE